VTITPAALVAAFARLGCVEDRGHSRKNYRWLELLDDEGHQVAIINIPTSKTPVRKGTLVNAILNPNGIRDEEHLAELLAAEDPPAAFRAILPAGGPRYRPHGQ
jgi:hypothetical protein